MHLLLDFVSLSYIFHYFVQPKYLKKELCFWESYSWSMEVHRALLPTFVTLLSVLMQGKVIDLKLLQSGLWVLQLTMQGHELLYVDLNK